MTSDCKGEGNAPLFLGERIIALLLYVGFIPALIFTRSKTTSGYLQTHRNQALTLFSFLGVIALLLLLLVLALSYAMVYYRGLVESGPTEVWLLSFIRKLLIVWVVFWGYAVFRALRGAAVFVPYLSFFAKRRFLHKAGFGVLCIAWAIFLIITPIVIMADSLVTSDTEKGRVFMVYEDQHRFPRPLFSLAALPMARAAVSRYGSGSMVLLSISPDAIQAAVKKGMVVIIASHGTAAGLLLEDGYFTPSDIPHLDEDSRLKFVYFAGCDSGSQREAWTRALAPATVKTYDRLTPVIEHLWWFWVEGPKVIRELP
ncbi:MAG: hypothetical protein KAH38_03445 [Candidatus Hydrogenedentes bacterium]|nr:hypothetical protein [Candidatus Hydrogenedentota bacterium]